MEKVVQKFRSFAEADAAELARRRAMSPQERMAEFFEIQRRAVPGGVVPRLAKVARVVKLSES